MIVGARSLRNGVVGVWTWSSSSLAPDILKDQRSNRTRFHASGNSTVNGVCIDGGKGREIACRFLSQVLVELELEK